ncbi:hypothetical protein [Erythrobacter litoralis]|uniref:Uncharacterized protein n=1 Tax=Erythrobacter litoralis (strain HTCC2594) TaxID=314225 RepID=Q2N8P3_ERYLH|nr:hypothetical protein [Erythrobacter litoralis]ABC63948.1 hypothetical protein ELI_09280 [Erythrobacter litoralis HTCC2594]
MIALLNPDKFRMRVPGALRFVDASNLADIDSGLEVAMVVPDQPHIGEALSPAGGGRWIPRRLTGVAAILPPLALRTIADREPVDPTTIGQFPDEWTGSERDYEVRVSDPRGRFLPARFTYSMPDPAQTHWDVWGNPPQPRIRSLLKEGQSDADYIPLFNRTGRTYDVPVARVAANLAIRLPDGRDRPAGWALLRIRSGNTTVGLGLADENGNVEVAFPYPELPTLTPAEAANGRESVTWTIRISVHFDDLSGTTAPDGSLLPPDFTTILGQLHGTATRALRRLGQPQALPNPELTLGERLILRTEDTDNTPLSSLYLEAS